MDTDEKMKTFQVVNVMSYYQVQYVLVKLNHYSSWLQLTLEASTRSEEVIFRRVVCVDVYNVMCETFI